MTARSPLAKAAARRPPGPRGLPIVGSALAFKRDPLAFFERCARDHGDIVLTRLMGRDVYLLFDPRDIERVFAGDAKGAVARELMSCELGRVLGQGLLASEGELWKRQRKLVAGALTRRHTAACAADIVAVGARHIADWRSGATIDLFAEMSRVTLHVIARTLFDVDVDDADTETIGRAMEVFSDYFADSPESVLGLPEWVPTPRNRRFAEARRALEVVLQRLIVRHRERGSERGLLAHLLAARHDDGTAMSDVQVRDECVTLFLTGHETSALGLAYALALLARHPAIAVRWRRELDEVCGGGDGRDVGAPAHVDLDRLVLTTAILKEGMRLCPPVWTVGREVIETFELGGYRVPRGSQLLCPQWIVHHDARWFSDPTRFDPNRFLGEPERALPRLAFFPFGAGPRACVGGSFAMMEMTLLLATIGQRFAPEAISHAPFRYRPSVTLRPAPGTLRVKLRRVA